MIVYCKETSFTKFTVEWQIPFTYFSDSRNKIKSKEFDNFKDAEGFLRQREKQGMVFLSLTRG